MFHDVSFFCVCFVGLRNCFLETTAVLQRKGKNNSFIETFKHSQLFNVLNSRTAAVWLANEGVAVVAA